MGWKEVGVSKGTRIVKKRMEGSDIQCIVATAEICCSPSLVYDLLADTDRISEYNEYFDEYERMQRLGSQAEVGWTSYKPVFPTSAREFVALCAWRKPGDMTHLEMKQQGKFQEDVDPGGGSSKWWTIASESVSQQQSDVVGPPRKGYTRGTIECAGYIMRWSPAFIEENGGVAPKETQEAPRPHLKKSHPPCGYRLTGVKPGVRPRIVFTSICQSNPGGSVPMSLVNSLGATAPYKVIRSIKKVVEQQ
jgi:hypothetical protein